MTTKKEPKRFFHSPIYTVKPLNFLSVMFENDYHIQCVLHPEFTAKAPQIFSDLKAAQEALPYIFHEALTLARNADCCVSFCFAFQCAVIVEPVSESTDINSILNAFNSQLREAYTIWMKVSKTLRDEIVL